MDEYFRNHDRRYYKRIDTDVDCLIHANNREFSGKIQNLSEEGIGLYINEFAFFSIGSEINVTGVDGDRICLFRIEVVRIDPGENRVFIGGKIVNQEDVRKYVEGKKAEHFLRYMREQQKM